MTPHEKTEKSATEQKLGAKRYVKESVVRMGGVALGVWRSIELDKKVPGRAIDQAKLNGLIATRLEAQRSHRYKDVLVRQPDLGRSIEQIYGKAKYWHGTGRYQRDADGSVKDLLSSILTDGLKPAVDMADMKRGPGQSLSVTNARMYGRVYAQTHSSAGNQLKNYYGSQSFWGGVFNGATLHDLIKGNEVRDLAKNALQNNAKTHGQTRVDHRGVTVTNYILGSNIPNNYPILIGIKPDSFEPVEISQYLSRYEQRSISSITPDQFTHIECPFENIKETKQLLTESGIDLTVLPIEATEEFVAQIPFTELASGSLHSSIV